MRGVSNGGDSVQANHCKSGRINIASHLLGVLLLKGGLEWHKVKPGNYSETGDGEACRLHTGVCVSEEAREQGQEAP